MTGQKLLIIEDESDVLELIRYNVELHGYKAITASDGAQGLELAKKHIPDGVVLDLMLPGLDGLDVCRQLKADSLTASIPIIIVSAKGQEADIVVGLELGADDYIVKPFSPRVLLARIKAVLRREKREDLSNERIVCKHGITIDPLRHSVSVNGSNIELTRSEFKILHFLASRPGWVFTRYQIVDAVHGDDYPVTPRSIDVQIAGLRKKLGKSGECIETVRGVGYKFRE
ncbi:MAG: DNA-binding response regulator [Candidatus Dadabacteria bacterium]|nr:MAG: DNA-binding response regulator [Candidatus Dadabacteria bacterium]